jgi:hypothetical protein
MIPWTISLGNDEVAFFIKPVKENYYIFNAVDKFDNYN